MRLIKRIIRQTSHKLLARLGGQRSSHRLVLNAPVAAQGHESPLARRRRARSSVGSRKSKKRSSREAALLLAAKNHLPPLQFHHVHGANAQLTNNSYIARRTSSFCQALVFSNRIILPNERVYIKVLDIAKGWSGTIRFGFTSVDPAVLKCRMPKHVCPDMTNAGHTWARALADDVVRKNSIIHFSYDKAGFIHYGINNQDCGIFCAKVNTSQHLWFVIDVYGLTTAVELIDPRVHNTAGLDDAHCSPSMEDEIPRSSNARRNRLSALERPLNQKKYEPNSAWNQLQRLRNSRLPSFKVDPEFLQRTQLTDLYRLEPAFCPMAQQNIYTPMPAMPLNRPAAQATNRNEPHDYYQIMSNNSYAPTNYANSPIRRRPTKRSTGAPNQHQINQNSPATASINNVSLMSAGTSSASNSSPTAAAPPPAHARSSTNSVNDEQEICEQLDSFQLSDISGQHHQQSVQSKSSKSTTNKPSTSAQPPVAAARKRLQDITSQTTNIKRSLDGDRSKITHMGATNLNSNISKAKASNSQNTSSKSRTRIQKSTTHRDSNNNTPPSKDCPICFERPINCVLYQCGHMCTCYECGVKQWTSSRSRSCPICRTIIKDVIKTYMS